MCGVVAVTALSLVSVVDPYSGATASPYYQPIATTVAYDRYGGDEVQTLELVDSVGTTVTRDGFGFEAAPKVVPASGAPSAGSAKAVALSMVIERGWPVSQFDCLSKLWQKESSWKVTAENRSSGAYGIPQSLPGSKMASVASDWRTNPATQIEWGLRYISARYGSPCGAWSHSQAVNWY